MSTEIYCQRSPPTTIPRGQDLIRTENRRNGQRRLRYDIQLFITAVFQYAVQRRPRRIEIQRRTIGSFDFFRMHDRFYDCRIFYRPTTQKEQMRKEIGFIDGQ